MSKEHLRLVSGLEKAFPALSKQRLEWESNGQFRLPFEDEAAVRRIVIVVMDTIHGTRLHSYLDDLRPKVVLDVRHAIRFDLPGTSRVQFFENIHNVGASYFQEPIEWHELKAQPLTVDDRLFSQRIRYEVVEHCNGHLMLLVSKCAHLRLLLPVLNFSLTRNHPPGWRIEEAI